MTKEDSPKNIHPRVVRGIISKDLDNPYQRNIRFFTRIGNTFYQYSEGERSDALLKGPAIDRFHMPGKAAFIDNGGGLWKQVNIGCLDVVKFALSEKFKVVKE